MTWLPVATRRSATGLSLVNTSKIRKGCHPQEPMKAQTPLLSSNASETKLLLTSECGLQRKLSKFFDHIRAEPHTDPAIYMQIVKQ
jgi:hypothetical protein